MFDLRSSRASAAMHCVAMMTTALVFVGFLAASPAIGVEHVGVEYDVGTPVVKHTFPIGKQTRIGGARLAGTAADYSNIDTSLGSVLLNGGATLQAGNTITRLTADDLTPTGIHVGQDVTEIQFAIGNVNATTTTVRVRVRFWLADGAGGAPGTWLIGYTFTAALPASSMQIISLGPLPTPILKMPGTKFWAGMTFDNNGGTTGATATQLNNLGQALFDPPTVGSSQDEYFRTSTAGSFFDVANPAGATADFGGTPIANFGWEFTTTGIEPGLPGTLYASTEQNGNLLLTINPANGAGTLVVDTEGLSVGPAIAIDSNGRLFGSNGEELYRIDAITGAATLIGSNVDDLWAMAFDENDVLYAISSDLITQEPVLFIIDPASGAATAVGPTTRMLGIAFDPEDGRLYGTDENSQLYLISKTTGAATLLGSTNQAQGYDLSFVGDELYGIIGQGPPTLIRINKATGAGTVVGLIGFAEVSGLTANSPCDCPALPGQDRASFKVGTPVLISGNTYEVPLLVNTPQEATYTQMTLEYDSNCLTYVANSAVTAIVGAEIVLVDNVVNGANSYIVLQLAGNYTGCDQEVLKLRFQRVGSTGSCALNWNEDDQGPNSYNHMNYTRTGVLDGKITPDDIAFCGSQICEPVVVVSGTVKYYFNNRPIVVDVPDIASEAVRVKDCGDGNPFVDAGGTGYSLSFGAGPQAVEICASRPAAACGSIEDGVVSGADVILMLNNPGGFADPKQSIAADVNRDGFLGDDTDLLAIKRWIARKVCDGTDACNPAGGPSNNCAATWRFIYLTSVGPNLFETDVAALGNVCVDRTVNVEGILLGDVDHSWPSIFPKASSTIALGIESRRGENGEVWVALRADLDANELLQHVIYSLSYDQNAFEYLGMQPGSVATTWGWFDNPDNLGEAHGIAHIPAQTEGLSESGEVIVFRFRPRHQEARSTISFTRLKANDIDVQVPGIEITGNGDATTVTTPLPTRYSVESHPNPFNPRTRVTYTIPAGVDRVPVELRIFDIAGRLVRTLESTERGPGRYAVDWDGKSDLGTSTGTGIYLLRISAGEWSEVEKLTLVK